MNKYKYINLNVHYTFINVYCIKFILSILNYIFIIFVTNEYQINKNQL